MEGLHSSNGHVLDPLADGWLQKESRWLHNWHVRYVVLSTDGILRTFNSNPFADARDAPHFMGSFSVSGSFAPSLMEENCVITEEVDCKGGYLEQKNAVLAASLTSFRFAVVLGRRRIWFAAESEEDRRRWLSALQIAVSRRTPTSRRASLSPLRFGGIQSRESRNLSPPRNHSSMSSSTGVQQPESEAKASGDDVFSPRKWLSTQRDVGEEQKNSPLIQPNKTCRFEEGKNVVPGRAESVPPAPITSSIAPALQIDMRVERKVLDEACDNSAELTASQKTLLLELAEDGPPKAAPPAQGTRGKGKGKGKGQPPGKAPPGKAPPPKGGAKAAAFNRAERLPIGRRLTLKQKEIDAEVFRGLLNGSSEAVEADRQSPGELLTPERKESPRQTLDPRAVDLEALRQAFAPQQAQPKKERARTKAAGVELLSREVAQNVAIVLTTLRLDTVKLAESLSELDPSGCTLSSDEASRLLEVWPPQDVVKLLQDYVKNGSDIAMLRDIERRMLPLVRLPRMGARLRLMIVASTLDDRVSEAFRQFEVVRSAAHELQKSVILRDLLAIILVLFNYINFGTQADAVTPLRGIDVHSLLRLGETKAYNGDFPGYNMLHFVVKQLIQQCPTLTSDQLRKELHMLPKASGVNLDGLWQELAEIKGDHAFVRCELSDHRADYEEPAPETVEVPDSVDETIISLCEEEDSLTAELPPPETPRVGKNEAEIEHFIIGGDETTPRRVSVTPRPPKNKPRSFVEKLLGRGLDMKAFAEAWIRGEAVFGSSEALLQPTASSSKVVRADDGEVPPPGWLWLCQASGDWQPCWCEVHACVLVMHKIEGQRCSGTLYHALEGAQITPLSSLHVSEEARSLAEGAPHSFEILDNSNETLRLSAATEREAERWMQMLEQQSQLPGSGYLWMRQNSGASVATWRRHYCCLHQGCLLAYDRLRYYIEGRDPNQSWRLSATSIRTLRWSGGGSDSIGSIASDDMPATFSNKPAPVDLPGFELEDRRSLLTWQFVCVTSDEEAAWMRAVAAQPPHQQPFFQEGTMNCQRTLFESIAESPFKQTPDQSEHLLFDLFSNTPSRSQTKELDKIDEADPQESREDELDRTRTLDDLRKKLELAFPPCVKSSPLPIPPLSIDFSDCDLTPAGEGHPPSRAMTATSSFDSITTSSGELVRANARTRSRSRSDTHGSPNRSRCVSEADLEGASRLGVVPPSLATIAQSPSSSRSSSSPSPSSPRDQCPHQVSSQSLCLQRLEELERKLACRIDEWEAEDSVTQDECRALLIFFGQEAPQGPRINAVSMQLFESMVEFTRQLIRCWSDVERAQRRNSTASATSSFSSSIAH